MKALIILAISAILFAPSAGADKYLGKLSENKYDSDSTSNPYGRYGSEHSQDSINNPYGAGSELRNDSPNNPLGEGLSIYHDDDG